MATKKAWNAMKNSPCRGCHWENRCCCLPEKIPCCSCSRRRKCPDGKLSDNFTPDRSLGWELRKKKSKKVGSE